MLTIALALGLVSSSAEKLPSRWIVELPVSKTALERHKIREYSGLIQIGDSFILGRDDGLLERRSLKTGDALWSIKLKGSIQSTWIESGDSIFGGDTKGNFYRIRSSDGEIVWGSKAKGAFLSQPLVYKDKVFVSNSLGTLLVFDLKTGEWKWQQADPQPSPSAIWNFSGPTVWQNAVIVGFPSGNLLALHPDSGDLLWKESFNVATVLADGLNDLKAVVSDGNLLVVSSFSGQLKVWEATKGSKKLLWEKRLSLHTPAVIEPTAIFYSAKDGSVGALDLRSGFERWKNEVPSGLATTPRILNEHVWIGTSSGEIIVYSIDGKILAKRESVESSFWNPPLVLASDEAIFYSSRGLIRRLHLIKS